MRIKLTSIMVDDQERALRFYTDVLGFAKKREIPLGEYRWLTVVSPEAPNETELSLEPNANPAGKAFQKAMFDQGIPVAAFEVSDLDGEHARLRARGVAFTTLAKNPDRVVSLLRVNELERHPFSFAKKAARASSRHRGCPRKRLTISHRRRSGCGVR